MTSWPSVLFLSAAALVEARAVKHRHEGKAAATAGALDICNPPADVGPENQAFERQRQMPAGCPLRSLGRETTLMLETAPLKTSRAPAVKSALVASPSSGACPSATQQQTILPRAKGVAAAAGLAGHTCNTVSLQHRRGRGRPGDEPPATSSLSQPRGRSSFHIEFQLNASGVTRPGRLDARLPSEGRSAGALIPLPTMLLRSF